MSEIVGLKDSRLLDTSSVYDSNQSKTQKEINATQTEINAELVQDIQELSSGIAELDAKLYIQTFNFTIDLTATSIANYVGSFSVPIDNALVSVSFEYIHTGANWGCTSLHYGDTHTDNSGNVQWYDVFIYAKDTGTYSITAHVASTKS